MKEVDFLKAQEIDREMNYIKENVYRIRSSSRVDVLQVGWSSNNLSEDFSKDEHIEIINSIVKIFDKRLNDKERELKKIMSYDEFKKAREVYHKMKFFEGQLEKIQTVGTDKNKYFSVSVANLDMSYITNEFKFHLVSEYEKFCNDNVIELQKQFSEM